MPKVTNEVALRIRGKWIARRARRHMETVMDRRTLERNAVEKAQLEKQLHGLLDLIEKLDRLLVDFQYAAGLMDDPSSLDYFIEYAKDNRNDYLTGAVHQLQDAIRNIEAREDEFFEEQERSQTAFRQAGV